MNLIQKPHFFPPSVVNLKGTVHCRTKSRASARPMDPAPGADAADVATVLGPLSEQTPRVLRREGMAWSWQEHQACSGRGWSGRGGHSWGQFGSIY